MGYCGHAQTVPMNLLDALIGRYQTVVAADFHSSTHVER